MLFFKKIVAATAIVSAIVPAVMVVRKRLKMLADRNKLSRAKAAGRKVPHAAKPRKARRIARHLAKTQTA